MKEFAKTLDMPGAMYDETSEGFMKLITDYGLSVAPTMLVFDKYKEVGRGNTPEEIQEILDGIH